MPGKEKHVNPRNYTLVKSCKKSLANNNPSYVRIVALVTSLIVFGFLKPLMVKAQSKNV